MSRNTTNTNTAANTDASAATNTAADVDANTATITVADADAGILEGLTQADIAAIVAKYNRQQSKRAEYRKEYFAKPEVKERRASARKSERAMIDNALATMVAPHMGNAAVKALWEAYEASEPNSSKRGTLRGQLFALLPTLTPATNTATEPSPDASANG